MPAESSPPSASSVDPQTWVDLMTVYALKGDTFSMRTLAVIHEGLEHLHRNRAKYGDWDVLTAEHINLFDRLRNSFNNPNLLKEAGAVYLDKFRLPGMALKHIELATQFAPKDRDLERMQMSAAMAVAHETSKQSDGHSGIAEAPAPKLEVSNVVRQTSKLPTVEARELLCQTTNELGRRQEEVRKTSSLKSVGPVEYQKLLTSAQALLAQSDYTGARALLEKSLKAGAPKEELQAYYAQLGLHAYDHGNMDEALEGFNRVRNLGPNSVEGWFNCGLVYQKMGRTEDALAAYMEAARITPDNAKVWCNLSSIWLDKGVFEEAENAARKSIEFNPAYARAWDHLASACSALNKLTEALEACREAIKIQPALHSAWFKLGVVNFQTNNYVLANEAFSTVADSKEFLPYALYYQSMIAARRGDFPVAVEKLAAARKAGPRNELEPTAVRELGAAFVKNGDYVEAAECYSRITQKDPQDFSAWLALGTACHRAEQPDEAREAYRKAIELNPESPVPWHNLGLLAADIGEHEDARKCFEREVELAPGDAKAWYDLGVTLRKLGHDVEAVEAFDHAESLVKSLRRQSDDLSAALSIVRRLNLAERVLKE